MITRRCLIGVALSGGLAAPVVHSTSALPAAGEGVELDGSVHSDDLVEFISVQAQINRSHPAWNRKDWRQLLGQLGIRYIRCNLANTRARDHIAALHQEYGIRACGLVTSINPDGSFDLAKTKEIIGFMRDEIGAEKIKAVEGPNEYTHHYKSDGWENRLRDYQEFIFNAFRSDAALKSLPVLAPTIWRRATDDYRKMAILGDYCDYGNLHLYSGGRRPSRFGRGVSDETMDTAIDEARLVTPNKPICVTETGFRVDDGRASSADLPVDVSAKYTVRNVAELFLRRDRVAWSNIYTLMDYSEDSDYGLVDLDRTPRKAFGALRNLISIVNDPGQAIAADLPCRLHASSPDVRWITLHKSDGRRLVLLWCDVDSFDRRSRQTLDNRPQSAILDFGDRTIGTALIHVPTVSDRPVKEYRAVASLELEVPDDVLVAELVP